jgi:rhodanese-related sulfurtransferase
MNGGKKMKIKRYYQYLLILLFTIILILPIGLSSNVILFTPDRTILNTQDEYIDITVSEAWDLLSDTSNGIQLPIDVRTDSEWVSSRIDTPFPEFPRHFEKNDIVDEESYQEFLDLYDGNDIIVYCKSGGRSATSANIITSRGFNGTVYNMLGGITDWNTQGLPAKSGNNKPSIPDTPEGPSVCTIGVPYEFTTQTTDPDDDPIRYGWDFNGDDYVDKWTDYGPASTQVSIEYGFVSTGSFEVSVLAEDLVGSQTAFSEKITVIANTPPSKPIIDGPSQGEAGTSYEYELVSTDNQESEISYFIEWGDGSTDGWTRTLQSGESLLISHTWNEKNNYVIRAKAKDEHQGESEWAILEVQMPKTHAYPWLTGLFDQHPYLKQIILSFF